MDDIDYMFAIPLRQLQLDIKCTFCDFLLGGFPLTEEEHKISISLLSDRSKQVMICLNAMDQVVGFELKELELNTALSSFREQS